MFIAALFTIAKVWKQPKCLSTDAWIKKTWCVCVCAHTHTHTHTMEYYSALKKERNSAICDNMDELGRHYAWYHLYVESKKKVELRNRE